MRSIILLITIFITSQSFSSTDLSDLSINGFGTFAFHRSDSDTLYFSSIKNKNNFFLGTKAGLIFNKPLSSEWDFTMMLLAEANQKGEVVPEVNILQAVWRPNSDFLGRIGRFRLPVWMISEYLKVGALIPWIRPPDEVYATIPLSEIDGLNTSYKFDVSNIFFTFDAFGGVGTIKQTLETSELQGKMDSVVGGVLSMEYDFISLRGSYTQGIFESKITSTTLTALASVPGSSIQSTVVTDFDLGRTKILSLGIKSEWKNTYFMAEYAKWLAESDIVKENQAYYILGGYYFLEKSLFTHFTYSRTTKVESTLAFYKGRQKSYIFGVNYSFNQNLMTKIDYRIVKPEGKAFFDKDLLGEEVHILGASIDFVF